MKDLSVYGTALPVAGMLHIFSNMTSEVLHKLSHYKSWWSMTSAVASMLINKWQQNRLVATCLLPKAGGAAILPDVRAVQTWPIDWRWGSIISFLRELGAV